MAQPPPLRFLFAHPAHFFACGLGSGLSPVAPGTAGTLFAWISYPVLRALYPADVNFAVFLGFMFVFGVWCIHITGSHLGEPDHGAIVWDEIVPFWAVLLLTPATLPWQAAAFVGFRVFDILKPEPAAFFDRQMKDGFGVMMDDVVAAGYTVLVLALGKVLLGYMF
jgi:phosphatidylglycerophosphatase A